MSLEVFEREVEEITILDLIGRLTIESGSTQLRERLSNLVGQGKKQLVLNLKEVPYIDSTGLGILVVSHSDVEKAGGELRLLNASKRHIELLALTKLTTVFAMFDNEEAAINSFFSDREVKHFDILEFVRSQKEERQHGNGSSSESNPEQKKLGQ